MSELINASTLAAELDAPDLLIVDTRFSLEDSAYGPRAYEIAHIPGAVYLNLDKDLSSPVIPGRTGRHPLPDPGVLEATLRAAGLRQQDRVVVYDDCYGYFAARLWWLLRWLGHDRVQVLDGGLAAWRAADLPLSEVPGVRTWPGDFVGEPDSTRLISAEEIRRRLYDSTLLLLDARTQERYQGDLEPIDPVAGHIPGAVCLPCIASLRPDGLFQDPEQLRQRFTDVADDAELACYCGSGVTACHVILAAVEAGLPEPRLYAGSWSEWIVDPTRPVAVGRGDDEVLVR